MKSPTFPLWDFMTALPRCLLVIWEVEGEFPPPGSPHKCPRCSPAEDKAKSQEPNPNPPVWTAERLSLGHHCCFPESTLARHWRGWGCGTARKTPSCNASISHRFQFMLQLLHFWPSSLLTCLLPGLLHPRGWRRWGPASSWPRCSCYDYL